jgi:CRISPR-associated endoribonuclease Cas6
MFIRKEIVFKSDRDFKLSYNYHFKVMANIYRYISTVNNDFEGFLHNKGYAMEDGRKFKLFNHTLLFKNAKFNSKYIEINKNTTIRLIVSGVKDVLKYILSGVLMDERLILDDNILEFIRVQNSNDKVIFNPIMAYKSISPIITTTKDSNGNVKCVSIEDEIKFFENLAYNAMRKYEVVFGNKFDNNSTPLFFDIDESSPIKIKKKSIKGYIATGYEFNVFVECMNLNMQKIIYYCGLGEKSSIGLGCLEYLYGEGIR